MGHELSKVKRDTSKVFRRSNLARIQAQIPVTASNLTGLVKGKRKTRKIVLLSLDAAGKTTLLTYLKNKKITNTIPTIGYNYEELEYKNACYSLWDVGGQSGLRQFWTHYFFKVNGIIFMVDSNDRERIQEAREVLVTVINNLRSTDAHLHCPILIIANKQDLHNCMTKEEIYDELQLNKYTDIRHVIISTSIVHGIGIQDILDWMDSRVKKQIKK